MDVLSEVHGSVSFSRQKGPPLSPYRNSALTVYMVVISFADAVLIVHFLVLTDLLVCNISTFSNVTYTICLNFHHHVRNF
jgi:hypothetical protein